MDIFYYAMNDTFVKKYLTTARQACVLGTQDSEGGRAMV